MFWGRDAAQDSKAEEEEQQQQQQEPQEQQEQQEQEQRVHHLWSVKKLGNSSRFVRVILAQGPC